MPRVLLAESNDLLRRTVAMTARATGLADVHEASSLSVARTQLMCSDFHGMLLRLDAERLALDLIELVRVGRSFTRADARVAVMTERCDEALAQALRVLRVEHVLLPPLRAKSLIQTIVSLTATSRSRTPN